MFSVVLVIHLMLAIGLVGVVLLQRSEGGVLGIGGGGAGGFMTGRGTANVLTRTTSILAALFFLTSIALSIIASTQHQGESLLEKPADSSAPAGAPAPASQPPAPATPSVPLPQ